MPKKFHNPLTPKDVAAIAYKWSHEELLEMRAIVDSLLEAAPEKSGEISRTAEVSGESAEESPRGKRGGGYFEDKMVNGCGPYRYLRYSSEGKRKSLRLPDLENRGFFNPQGFA